MQGCTQRATIVSGSGQCSTHAFLLERNCYKQCNVSCTVGCFCLILKQPSSEIQTPEEGCNHFLNLCELFLLNLVREIA
jgi:hypothetical protein